MSTQSGAAFDRAGRLLAVDSARDELLQIDPLTGAVLAAQALRLGGAGFDLSTVTDIAARPDGTLVLTDITRFYALDVATAALQLLLDEGSNQAFR